MKPARMLLVSTMAVAIVTVVAPAAPAVPPEVVFDETFEESFTIPAGEVCDFAVDGHTVGRAVHRHYFNKDGEVVKHQSWFSGTDTFTNPESGITLDGTFSGSDFQRQHGDELGPIAVNGLVFHITAPGGGAVLIDAGRVVFDFETGEIISISGPHQALDGDFEELCAALA